MYGVKLIEELSRSTGLPFEKTKARLLKVLEAKHLCIDSITLEDIREVLAELLQDVLLEAKTELNT